MQQLQGPVWLERPTGAAITRAGLIRTAYRCDNYKGRSDWNGLQVRQLQGPVWLERPTGAAITRARLISRACHYNGRCDYKGLQVHPLHGPVWLQGHVGAFITRVDVITRACRCIHYKGQSDYKGLQVHPLTRAGLITMAPERESSRWIMVVGGRGWRQYPLSWQA